MDDFALTPAERALFRALTARGVRFLVVNLGAAVLEGAPVSTQDLDIWRRSTVSHCVPAVGKVRSHFAGRCEELRAGMTRRP